MQEQLQNGKGTKMIINQRVLFNNSGTEKDISVDMANFRALTSAFAYETATDYLYIGSFLPFTHKYFLIESPNAVSTSLSVDIWKNKEWIPAVDIIDNTASSGASFATSGIVRFTTDREESWQREIDSEDVTGISKVGLYNLYWARFSWDQDFTASTSIKYIGNLFSGDDELYSYYPDLQNSALQDAFETGKTDWQVQHFMAAEMIIRDLKKRNIVLDAAQIRDYEKFLEASCHKVAEIIYWGLGRSYDESRQTARRYYDEAINLNFYNADINADGTLSRGERGIRAGFIRR